MLKWTGLSMGFQKVVQHMQKCQNMRLVPALLSLADIVHDHVPDFLAAMLLIRKVLSESRSSDFRQMLMFRNCENLFLGQAA